MFNSYASRNKQENVAEVSYLTGTSIFMTGEFLYMMTKDLEDLVLSIKLLLKMPAVLFPLIGEKVLM